MVGQAADSQALPLADRVIHQAPVFAQVLALKTANLAGLCRQVLLQEIPETALADKADAGGVLLFCRSQPVLLGQFAHVRFCHGAQRKERLFQFAVADGVQEIALVLVAVQALEQGAQAVRLAAAGVVSGGYCVRAQRPRVVQESPELDFAIAQDIRVGCAPRAIFLEEVLEHVVPVFRGEIGSVQGDAQFVRHGLRIGKIHFGGTVLGAVVLVPVLHEQPLHPVALLFEQQRGHGRIDAAGHADDNCIGGIRAH